MTNKTDKQFFFQVQLDWVSKFHGVLTARDAEGAIQVATPPEFGGDEAKPWTPEHLFLSAICSCFMSTLLSYTKKSKLEMPDFKCEAIGQIEIVNGKYKFTNINLYPKLYIFEEQHRNDANIILEKTQKYCLVSNSINATLFYHSEIILYK
jgi:organic hydroperoxide reductase OsmC/OhrA